MRGFGLIKINLFFIAGVVTSDVDKMYLTIYNDSDTSIALTVYSNKTERLDTFTLQPGKNILSFAYMQQLKWFPRKGMTTITFKVTTSDVSETNLQFGGITVMNK